MLGNGDTPIIKIQFSGSSETDSTEFRLITCIESYYCQVCAKYFSILGPQNSPAIVLLLSHITVEVTEA